MKYRLSNKNILKLSALGAVLILAVIAYMVLMGGKKEPATSTSAIPRDNTVERVFIKDFYKESSPLSPDTKRQVENMLYSRAGREVPDLYTGVIRPESYSRTVANTVVITKFLVDVEPANLSFNVTITTIGKNDSASLICAPKAQQMDSSAVCEDPEYT